MIVGLVRFTPGARTNWHSHDLGQTLHVTDGIGLVVTRDGNVIRMHAGDTVYTPPGEDHWHGATDGNFMSHLALLEGAGHYNGTTWVEPVTDDQYRAATSTRKPRVRKIVLHNGIHSCRRREPNSQG
jgi:quercetin dioxygenase-like cupin family protein